MKQDPAKIKELDKLYKHISRDTQQDKDSLKLCITRGQGLVTAYKLEESSTKTKQEYDKKSAEDTIMFNKQMANIGGGIKNSAEQSGSQPKEKINTKDTMPKSTQQHDIPLPNIPKIKENESGLPELIVPPYRTPRKTDVVQEKTPTVVTEVKKVTSTLVQQLENLKQNIDKSNQETLDEWLIR
jgi:hypothetical protein